MHPRLIRLSARTARTLGLQGLLGTPKGFLTTREWIAAQPESSGAKMFSLIPPSVIVEKPPVIVGHPIGGRFTRHYQRNSREGFVAVVPEGRVFGEYTNIIISPDNYILSDVSREFGAEGGRRPQDFSLFHSRLQMPPKTHLRGKTAVVSTCGANNFHHWNYDVLPRLYLLRRAGLLDGLDHLIINYKGLPFQLEGLSRLGIDRNKIVNSHDNPLFHVQAELLYVPSLPEDLGTISPWVLEFLRETFLTSSKPGGGGEKLFISRRNAPSRRIINETEVMKEIYGRGYVEFIPEAYSMEETAACFSKASSIVSVHGSGLSNLAFINDGAKVLDIMAPYHQDPYYWMITNSRGGLYVALFSEGDHPADDLDLVRNKIDDDLLIDIHKLKKALDTVA